MGCDQIRSRGKSSQILLAAPLRRFQLSPKQIETLLWSPIQVCLINDQKKKFSVFDVMQDKGNRDIRMSANENVYVCWCPWLLCCYVIIFRVWQYSRARKSIHLVLSSPHAIFSNSVDHATLSYSLHHIRAHQIHQTKLTTSGSIYFPPNTSSILFFLFAFTESVICPEPPRTGLVSPSVSKSGGRSS